MEKGKIEIMKINNTAARRVTFCKKRRELFKKAKELAVLCNSDVGITVFSASGKLHEYASSSMKEILERHELHSKSLHFNGQSSLELQLADDCTSSKLIKEVAARSRHLRLMRGEELQGMSIDELQQLETSLEAGLNRIMKKKDQKIQSAITRLQEKGKQLMEENARMNQLVAESMICDEEQWSESVSSNSNGPPQDSDSSDTSLQLGLP